MYIEVEYKRAYGNDRYYPSCKDSRIIASLMDCKSFKKESIDYMELMGWQVKVKGQTK